MAVTINADTSNGLVMTPDTSGEIKLQSAGADTVTVNTSGNVGIGTTTPDTKFHVQSSDASSLTNRTDLVGVFEKSGGASISIATDSTSSSSILFADNGDADGCEIEYDHTVNDLIFKVGGNVERARIEDSGNLKFNSGYGSVATAYGCRAWVNFNGTGTVAIRASGNVSSITDNGTGLYTLNFTTAMPDANYSVVTAGMGNVGMVIGGIAGPTATGADLKTTSAVRVRYRDAGNTAQDVADCNYAIFR